MTALPSSGLVDLHTHMLPGVDDGSGDLRESIAMARQAAADGISVVCATPHIHIDHDVEIASLPGRVAALNAGLSGAGVPVEVTVGGELSAVLAERLTDDEARAYFVTRTRESRLGAWASPQSRPLRDRDELDGLYAKAEERFAGDDVPLPEWWGGYRIVPHAFELWQNRPYRLHDRARYERADDGWSRSRLGP